MAEFTPYEQLLLELVNRARLNPEAEASRLGIGLNDGLAPGTISATPKQPLASNNLLVDAARGHSQYMVDSDQFAHQDIGDGTPTSRILAAKYNLTGAWMTGENIAYVGTTGTLDVLASTYAIADNLFRSHGHRENILQGDFRELGTGFASGPFVSGGHTYNVLMGTESFAKSGDKYFVSGVAINDRDGDNFYDVGEAHANVRVVVTTANVADGSDVTEAAGGYGVAVGSGAHVVTFSEGGLAAPVSATVFAGFQNVKVDLSGANEILSSASTALGNNAKDLVLLGASGISGYGNDLNNVIIGNAGGNAISGGSGKDVLSGMGGRDLLRGDAGRDILTGGAGADTFDFNKVLDSVKGAATRDVITDFTHNAVLSLSDRIDLSTIDANGAVVGDTAFKWRGTAAFEKGVPGQLHYFTENPVATTNDKTIIEGDLNGDKIADFQIELTGIKALFASDFIL